MENIDKTDTLPKDNGVGKLIRILLMAAMLIAFLLLGFYIGTRYGLETATKAALQFIEYQASNPREADLALLDSVPAAVYGNETADKELRVFIDLGCPACSTLMEESIKKTVADSSVRIEFYDYPSDSHKYSRLAAAYTRCAVEDGVDYLSYVSHLNADFSEWTSMLKESNVSEYLLQTSIKYGADEDSMNLCVISEEVYQDIDANIADAVMLGVDGTPSFIIGNHLITGFVSENTFNSMLKEFSK